jgi:ABC-type transport system substrate-binding protein
MSKQFLGTFLLVAVVSLGLSSLAKPAFSQTLSIGFPEFPQQVDLLESEHPLAVFVRAASLGALVRQSPAPTGSSLPVGLELSDSLSIQADGGVWSFRVSKRAFFSSGGRIQARDAVFSLKRCIAKHQLAGIVEVTARSVKNGLGNEEGWVDLKLEAPQLKPNQKFPANLASCPILEEQSAKLFGLDLGKGSNLVSSGAYVIRGFSAGREYTLARLNQLVRESPEVFVLRGFSEPEHGLSALRSGTLDAFFTTAPGVLDKARQDETLLISECAAYSVILRKGLVLPCVPRVAPLGIKYSAHS